MHSFIKNTLIILFLVLGIYSYTQAQVQARITIANEEAIGTDYFFDLYLHEDAGSSGPIFMGDAQFRIAFNVSKFTTAELHKALRPESELPFPDAQDGYNTFIPTNSSFFNDVSTRTSYFKATAVSLHKDNPAVLNIEINGPGPADVSALEDGVARIDDGFLTHRIGRYRIAGYVEGSGNPDLAIVYDGSIASAVLSYDPVSLDASAVVINSDILPVEWLGFTAKELNHQEVALEWITGAEINNDRFEIEKMLKHGEFQKIGELKSLGNTQHVRTYQFFDNTPMTDVVYYRIKQVDLDGTSTYSDTEEVKFNFYGGEAYVAYPSPAEDQITLEALDNINQAHEYWVVDIQGREIIQGKIEEDKAMTKINVSDLAEGNYYIKIKSPRADIFNLKFTKK